MTEETREAVDRVKTPIGPYVLIQRYGYRLVREYRPETGGQFWLERRTKDRLGDAAWITVHEQQGELYLETLYNFILQQFEDNTELHREIIDLHNQIRELERDLREERENS